MNPSNEYFTHWIYYIKIIYMDEIDQLNVIPLWIKFDGSYYILGELHPYYECKHDWGITFVP